MRHQATAANNVISDKLGDIARRLRHLSPDYQNPERYYRRRDDLVDELVTMARRG